MKKPKRKSNRVSEISKESLMTAISYAITYAESIGLGKSCLVSCWKENIDDLEKGHDMVMR